MNNPILTPRLYKYAPHSQQSSTNSLKASLLPVAVSFLSCATVHTAKNTTKTKEQAVYLFRSPSVRVGCELGAFCARFARVFDCSCLGKQEIDSSIDGLPKLQCLQIIYAHTHTQQQQQQQQVAVDVFISQHTQRNPVEAKSSL